MSAVKDLEAKMDAKIKRDFDKRAFEATRKVLNGFHKLCWQEFKNPPAVLTVEEVLALIFKQYWQEHSPDILNKEKDAMLSNFTALTRLLSESEQQ